MRIKLNQTYSIRVSYIEQIEERGEVLRVALTVLSEGRYPHPIHVLEQICVHVSEERRVDRSAN